MGVNCYRIDEEEPEVAMHPYDEAEARAQVEKLRSIRAERDNTRVRAALHRVRQAAQANENTMPAITEAVKAYATVGEINGVLMDVYGQFQEPIRF